MPRLPTFRLLLLIRGIQDARTGLVTNYLPPSANKNFQDASSTALLAASAYRLSTVFRWHDFVAYAEKSRKALSAPSSTTTSARPTATAESQSTLAHFVDGWLTPVVDPLNVGKPGQRSPEGQAFVMEMQGAWKDWMDAGGKGSSTCGRYDTRLISTEWLVYAFVVWMLAFADF
jgi:hypothetical protein